MSTNNTFSFDRFGKYFRLYMTQNGRLFTQSILSAYAIFSLIFVVIASILYSSLGLKLTVLTSQVSSMTSGVSVMVIIPLMCIVASHMMHTTQNKRVRLQTLTLPASSLEKYLSYWLVHVIGFFIAYFSVIYFADVTRTLLCKLFYPDFAEHIAFSKATLAQPISFKEFFSDALVSLAFVQSYFVLGSTVWKRYNFFKTLGFCIIGLFAILFGLNMVSEKARFILYLNALPEYSTCILLIPTAFNWYMGYRHFKEAELVPHL